LEAPTVRDAGQNERGQPTPSRSRHEPRITLEVLLISDGGPFRGGGSCAAAAIISRAAGKGERGLG
jgi:hypothetical protein